MSNINVLIFAIKEANSYSKKNRIISQLIDLIKSESERVTSGWKPALCEFVLEELPHLLDPISTAKLYKDKYEILIYSRAVFKLTLFCYPELSDLPEEYNEHIKTIKEIHNRESYVDLAIIEYFEKSKRQKEDTEKVLNLISDLKDETHKTVFYRMLIQKRSEIAKLPYESKAIIGKFIALEMRRYLDAAPDEDMQFNIELACAIASEFTSNDMISVLKDVQHLKNPRINRLVINLLLDLNQEVSKEAIDDLANNLEFAYLIFAILESHNKLHLAPSILNDDVYLAKSDMVHWLTYPTELGKQPDEIEFLGKVTKRRTTFYIFKFRSDSETLNDEAKNTWLIGWATPGNTFSNFEPLSQYEKKTLKKTLRYIRRKAIL